MSDVAFSTDQEAFWAGQFGSEYISRNRGASLLASNLGFFSTVLRHAGRIRSCIELGANIGMNLKAMSLLYPDMEQHAIEINQDAARELVNWLGQDRVFAGSILEWQPTFRFDLVLVKGVLIHMNPDVLGQVYEKMYAASNRLILVCEYYNPTPLAIPYRGHANRLFKRDFAGEILEQFDDLHLLDYGFFYRRDPVCPHDDITWFLLEKGCQTC